MYGTLVPHEVYCKRMFASVGTATVFFKKLSNSECIAKYRNDHICALTNFNMKEANAVSMPKMQLTHMNEITVYVL